MRQLTAILLALFSFIGATSQSSISSGVADTDSAINIYHRKQGNELPLYNGRQYHGLTIAVEGDEFFQSRDWQAGSVLFDNVWYYNTNILYDIYKDEVIIRSPAGLPFILFNERVGEFMVGNQTFVRLTEERDHIKTGYYQQLATGRMTVYVKRIKKLSERVVQTSIERKFIYSEVYYVFMNGKRYTIKKQKDILNLVEEYRSQIAQSLNQNNISYKADPQGTIIHIAGLYNQLSK